MPKRLRHRQKELVFGMEMRDSDFYETRVFEFPFNKL